MTRGLTAMALALACLLAAAGAKAETRSLKLYFLHTKERAEITYKINGKYVDSGLKKINQFLRDWRRNEPTKMDPALLDLVWEAYQLSGSRDYIHVVSAYRSPTTNNMLRQRGRGVAKNSQHTLGKAMDFFLPDVKLAKLREVGLKLGFGGVGYYPSSGSPFVHMDTGNVRHWPKMTRQQLAAVFPDGKTMHIPSDGKPMPGYDRALAAYKARRSGASNIVIAKAEEPKKLSFFERLAQNRNAKEENKPQKEEIQIASASSSDEDTDESSEAVPVPASPQRSPSAAESADLPVTVAQTGGLDVFPQKIPVPTRRPEHGTPDLLIDQTRQMLLAGRSERKATEVAALTPAEIESLRREAVATESAAPVPVAIITGASGNEPQGRTLTADLDPGRLAPVPETRLPSDPDLVARTRAALLASKSVTPRPDATVPIVALVEEPRTYSPFASAAEAATRQGGTGLRPTATPASVAKPVPPANVPKETLLAARMQADGFALRTNGIIPARGHTGAVRPDPATTTATIAGRSSPTPAPARETLEMALAATEPDGSARQAITGLVAAGGSSASSGAPTDVGVAAQEAAQADGGPEELQPVARLALLPIPSPRPVPERQFSVGKPVDTKSAVSISEGQSKSWALASNMPIGMISQLSAPAYGKLAYNAKEPRYLMAGFAKAAQRYNAGSLSAARIDEMFRDASQ